MTGGKLRKKGLGLGLRVAVKGRGFRVCGGGKVQRKKGLGFRVWGGGKGRRVCRLAIPAEASNAPLPPQSHTLCQSPNPNPC